MFRSERQTLYEHGHFAERDNESNLWRLKNSLPRI